MMNVEDESSALSSSSSFDVVTQNPSSPAHDKPTASHKRKAGRKKFRETRHPVYRGVRQRNLNRWVCEMREPNKKSRIWVGTFNSPEMAARAHDVAVIALGGDTAKLNFSNSVEVLPRPNSSSVRDIQIAALEATRVLTSQMPCSSTPSPPPLNHSRNKYQTNLQKPLTECQLSSHDLVDSTVATDSSATVFLDEEALFNMPGLIASMAEGLLLTPPALKRGFNWDDMGKCDMDLTLWKP